MMTPQRPNIKTVKARTQKLCYTCLKQITPGETYSKETVQINPGSMRRTFRTRNHHQKCAPKGLTLAQVFELEAKSSPAIGRLPPELVGERSEPVPLIPSTPKGWEETTGVVAKGDKMLTIAAKLGLKHFTDVPKGLIGRPIAKEWRVIRKISKKASNEHEHTATLGTPSRLESVGICPQCLEAILECSCPTPPSPCPDCHQTPKVSSHANKSWLFKCRCKHKKPTLISGTADEQEAVDAYNTLNPKLRLSTCPACNQTAWPSPLGIHCPNDNCKLILPKAKDETDEHLAHRWNSMPRKTGP